MSQKTAADVLVDKKVNVRGYLVAYVYQAIVQPNPQKEGLLRRNLVSP